MSNLNKSNKLNMHNTSSGSHVASCLCCTHLEYVPDSAPYSDLTPGDRAYLHCNAKVFADTTVYDEKEFHETCLIGQNCDEFKGRKE